MQSAYRARCLFLSLPSVSTGTYFSCGVVFSRKLSPLPDVAFPAQIGAVPEVWSFPRALLARFYRQLPSVPPLRYVFFRPHLVGIRMYVHLFLGFLHVVIFNNSLSASSPPPSKAYGKRL